MYGHSPWSTHTHTHTHSSAWQVTTIDTASSMCSVFRHQPRRGGLESGRSHWRVRGWQAYSRTGGVLTLWGLRARVDYTIMCVCVCVFGVASPAGDWPLPASQSQCSRGSQCDGCAAFILRRASPNPASPGSASAFPTRPASGAGSRSLFQDLLLWNSQVSIQRYRNPRNFHLPVCVRRPGAICRQASYGECGSRVGNGHCTLMHCVPGRARSHATLMHQHINYIGFHFSFN